MPQCIECGFFIDQVINPETRTVNRCSHCDRICDTYYEFDEVQKWVDVALLRRRAWTHILFNEQKVFAMAVYVTILCCFLEAFVVRSSAVLRSAPPPPLTDAAVLTSLQLVRIIKGPYLSMMRYTSTLPTLIVYAVQEFALVAGTGAWIGNTIRSPHPTQHNPLRRWVLVVSLAHASKLCYVFFLIWMTPSSLLPIVDLIFFLWLVRGFRALLTDQSWFVTFACAILCALVRGIFRFATGWAPQLLLA